MTILLICAAAGGVLGLISGLRKGGFLPLFVALIAGLVFFANRWLPFVGVENRIDGEGVFELISNFFAALTPQGQMALPVFIAALCGGRYLAVLIVRYKETHGEDPRKKKLRILGEHGLKEFD